MSPVTNRKSYFKSECFFQLKNFLRNVNLLEMKWLNYANG